jgi:uncharacterized protein with WD repeat
MPHTTTKGTRSNRRDTRPNEKKRRAFSKRAEDMKTIQDIRVTSKRSKDKKEREVTVTELRKKSKGDVEKIMRALKKKLRQIEELLGQEKAGIELDSKQRTKVDGMEAILAEMSELTDV